MWRFSLPRRLVGSSLLLAVASMPFASSSLVAQNSKNDPGFARVGRNPNQAIDSVYTRKIKEYTTEPFFLSPLVDYMPASKTVPTPMATLGDIAGARNKLPYSKE